MSGLAVASRLADDPRFSVLVIEAGPDEQNNTIVNDPADATPSTMTFSWEYQTTPQAVGGNAVTIFQSVLRCRAVIVRNVSLALTDIDCMDRGKLLGGSSSVNGMQWTRATLDQYDSFERLGNTGWNSTALFQSVGLERWLWSR